MEYEKIKEIYELLRDKDILDDILKLIFENSRLNYDENSLLFDDERKLFDYLKLKFENKYNERLEQLKNEKIQKEK